MADSVPIVPAGFDWLPAVIRSIVLDELSSSDHRQGENVRIRNADGSASKLVASTIDGQPLEPRVDAPRTDLELQVALARLTSAIDGVA